MKSLKLTALTILAALSFGFTPNTENMNLKSKRFDACCDGQLSLEIKSDQSFHYINKMNELNPVDVTGTWVFKSGVIVLQTEEKIPTEWKISRSSSCLKGMVDGQEVIQVCG